MPVAIEDVPMWVVNSGKGCALTHSRSGWNYTLCGSIHVGGGAPTRTRPRRICRACRERLALPTTNARPEKNEDGTREHDGRGVVE